MSNSNWHRTALFYGADTLWGESLQTAAALACRWARAYNSETAVDFNGIILRVSPHNVEGDIIQQYHLALAHRARDYRRQS